MPTRIFILTYACVVLESGCLTARAGRDRVLGTHTAWLAKLRKTIPVLLTLGEPILQSHKGCHKPLLWPHAHITRDFLAQCWEHTIPLHSPVLEASLGLSCFYTGGGHLLDCLWCSGHTLHTVHLTYTSDPTTFGSCHECQKKPTDKN